MPKNANIKYYPVGNGDTSLITLEDKTTILIDCNIRNCENEDNYDVKSDLLKSVQYNNGIPYVDVFILTHGDQDHCRGFKKNFFQGAPENYSDSDKTEGLIRVDAMWFSPMIAEEWDNDDERAYQEEAERRLALHRKKDAKKDNPGNRIKIIGYDGSADYKDLDHLRAIPGDIVTRFNDRDQSLFSIFIHAPFKEHLEALGDDKKNSTSIIFQARFRNAHYQEGFSSLAMFGGDSDHTSWCIVLEKTRKYKNEHALYWDLFLSPHHCSWSFFNDRPQDENPEPKKTSLEVLDYKRAGAKIIASSKKIEDDDDNPPHFKAKQEYCRKLESSRDFFNTSVEPNESTPEPLVFEITESGVKKLKTKNEIEAEKLAAALSVASSGVIKKPWRKKDA